MRDAAACVRQLGNARYWSLLRFKSRSGVAPMPGRVVGRPCARPSCSAVIAGIWRPSDELSACAELGAFGVISIMGGAIRPRACALFGQEGTKLRGPSRTRISVFRRTKTKRDFRNPIGQSPFFVQQKRRGMRALVPSPSPRPRRLVDRATCPGR